MAVNTCVIVVNRCCSATKTTVTWAMPLVKPGWWKDVDI